MARCKECGLYHGGLCDPNRKVDYHNQLAIKQAQSDLTSLEAEFSEYLQSKQGRFDLYYIEHQSERGYGISSGSKSM